MDNRFDQLDLEYEKLSRLNQIYLMVISRYKDHIEASEEISVAQLPTMVMPKSNIIMQRANIIKKAFASYNYDSDFRDAANMAFEFIINNVDEINLPLQFWLTPEETLRFMAGDITDRAILLCSLFIALDNPSSKVLIVTNESNRTILVYYDLDGKTVMYDLSKRIIKEFSTRDNMIESLSRDESTTIYEFNDQMYIDII